jgi:hypothetical protein
MHSFDDVLGKHSPKWRVLKVNDFGIEFSLRRSDMLGIVRKEELAEGVDPEIMASEER